MTFEDEVVAVMRAHDDEAPGVDVLADLPRGGVPAGRRWVPVAAAAAVVLLVVALAVALGRHRGRDAAGPRVESDGGLRCPARYHQQKHESGPIWVPAKPDGVTAKHHLVPAKTPTHAVVCAYESRSPSAVARLRRRTVPLTGRAILSGSLNELRSTLHPLSPGGPVMCLDYLTRTDGDSYLIGITYASGTIWVSVPGNHCSGSANGAMTSDVNLRAYAATSFHLGMWTAVPLGATSVSVSTIRPAGASPAIRRLTAGVDTLAGAINGALAGRVHPGCAGKIGPIVSTYSLTFEYPYRSPVSVRVSGGCEISFRRAGQLPVETSGISLLIARLLR